MLLKKLDVPNKLLQSKTATFLDAVAIVNTTKEVIQEMNNEDTFLSYWNQITFESGNSGQPSAKRTRIVSRRLAGYEYDPCGPADVSTFSSEPPLISSTPTDSERCKAWSTYHNLLNGFIAELNKRFGELQCNIAISVEATHPASKNFMEKVALQPLADLVGLVLDDAELQLVKKFFALETGRANDPASIQASPITEAMPTVRQIVSLARTIGVSTAVCESPFSTLKRILTPQRRSMLHQRKAELILISFEKELAKNIQCSGSLMRRFWETGQRRLQLF